MKVRSLIAQILKAQGVRHVFTFPTNPLLEGVAEEGIRIVTGRTERHAIHMADGYSRATNGNPPGVCIVQGGPGVEHAFAGVAQAYADSTPMLILAGGPPSARWGLPVEFDPLASFSRITKWSAVIRSPQAAEDTLRRAFTQLTMGRRRPVLVATPGDIANEEAPASSYQPVRATRSAADPADVEIAARLLRDAKHPVIFAGQGVLWAQGSDALVRLAEQLQAPVMTTLLGKSAFPENHPLALGAAGPAVTGMIEHFLGKADVVLGIGAGLTRSLASCPIPPGKTIIQATVDESDVNAEYRTSLALIGDARLVLEQLSGALGRTDRQLGKEIQSVKQRWMQSWTPRLTSEEVPVNPYRVIGDLIRSLEPANTIITHDSGMPREQITPFYEATHPRSYLGWGNSHQLGSSLGLIMGAKLACPDKLAVHVLGDAGLATCATDLETGVRERIPVLTVLLNNSTMAYYDQWIPLAIERYRVTDVTGDPVKLAQALGCYAETVRQPAQITPALQRCIGKVRAGTSAVLEVVTKAENVVSKWGATHG